MKAVSGGSGFSEAGRQAPRWIVFRSIADHDALSTISYCLRQHTPLQAVPPLVPHLARARGVSFPIGTECFYALLATKHGNDVWKFLLRHPSKFRNSVITSIHAFQVPDDRDNASGSPLPSLIFRLEPLEGRTALLQQIEQQNQASPANNPAAPMRLEYKELDPESHLSRLNPGQRSHLLASSNRGQQAGPSNQTHPGPLQAPRPLLPRPSTQGQQ